MVGDSKEVDKSMRGQKRKAPNRENMSGKEKLQKKPWGTNGPPPPEWIEVSVA
jgi:hypothetical protein